MTCNGRLSESALCLCSFAHLLQLPSGLIPNAFDKREQISCFPFNKTSFSILVFEKLMNLLHTVSFGKLRRHHQYGRPVKYTFLLTRQFKIASPVKYLSVNKWLLCCWYSTNQMYHNCSFQTYNSSLQLELYHPCVNLKKSEQAHLVQQVQFFFNPTGFGFDGKYCLIGHLPENGIICSSIDRHSVQGSFKQAFLNTSKSEALSGIFFKVCIINIGKFTFALYKLSWIY
ncbi:hypothetical protein TNCT_638231 [Trichonephila clavata]|uniref:Uncharacterized protein n=1 Tax=Trichonephila clavata TaxID=2740835 RepID=A0A8X6LD77_TRICU|nr:hypothetical protein TNCT_638231 [Trichonephila clavata]